MTTPQMVDNGEKQTFETGAVRDTAEGKPMYRFLAPFAWNYVHPKYGSYMYEALEESLDIERLIRFKKLYSILMKDMGAPRLLEWLRQGSIKYDAFNWAKGISCLRCIDSCGRHLAADEEGEVDEDHIAAFTCNVMFICQYLDREVGGKPINGVVDFYDFNS